MFDFLRAVGADARPDLLPEQKRLILQFRALRNGLGNHGRHQETPDNALLASPTITYAHGNLFLTFAEPLPAETAWVLLQYPGGEVSKHSVNEVSDRRLLIHRQDVVTVEVADRHDDVLAIGIPTDHTTPPATLSSYTSPQGE